MSLHTPRLALTLAILFHCVCFTSASAAQEVTSIGSRKIISTVKPEYPVLARKNNLDGTVKVLAVVSPDGGVTRCEVLGGNPVFVRVVVDAVRRWKWQPSATETKEPIQVTFSAN